MDGLRASYSSICHERLRDRVVVECLILTRFATGDANRVQETSGFRHLHNSS